MGLIAVSSVTIIDDSGIISASYSDGSNLTTQINEDGQVRLVISAGKEEINVPKISKKTEAEAVKTACNVATRILGFVNAPSIMQKVIAKCLDVDVTENVAIYNRNREALYNGLKERGFECIKPEGAFYMFVKAPGDDKEFCEAAKKYNILMVPGTAFGCPGFVRIAYCVAYDTIINAMPGFKKLAEEYGL